MATKSANNNKPDFGSYTMTVATKSGELKKYLVQSTVSLQLSASNVLCTEQRSAKNSKKSTSIKTSSTNSKCHVNE